MEWVCRAHRRFRPDLSSETCALNSHRLYPRPHPWGKRDSAIVPFTSRVRRTDGPGIG
jgi:hypothetical protein